MGQRSEDEEDKLAKTLIVAVYVPTYNRAERLQATLSSLLEQTWGDFYLTVVDDCSTDDTAGMVAGFNDPRLRYVCNAERLGMCGNWNRCVELALEGEAPYVLIAHDDDWYAPKLLEREIEFLEKNRRAGLVYPAFHYYNEAEGRFSSRKPYSEDRLMTAIEALDELCFKGKYCIATPAVLARRDAYMRAGSFDASFKICPDLDLWWRMLEHYDIGYINEHLHIHTVHKSQVSSSPNAVEDTIGQKELKRTLDRALERIIARRPDLDAARYQERISHYCAQRALLGAKDALLSGQFLITGRVAQGACGLNRAVDVCLAAAVLQMLNNPVGRFFCLVGVKIWRRVRAKPVPILNSDECKRFLCAKGNPAPK